MKMQEINPRNWLGNIQNRALAVHLVREELTTQMPVTQSLSPREIEVLKLAAEGTSNKGIAWILGISEQTTKNHISSILHKLNAENRTQAVVLALEQNLVEPKMSSQNNHDDNFRLVAGVR